MSYCRTYPPVRIFGIEPNLFLLGRQAHHHLCVTRVIKGTSKFLYWLGSELSGPNLTSGYGPREGIEPSSTGYKAAVIAAILTRHFIRISGKIRTCGQCVRSAPFFQAELRRHKKSSNRYERIELCVINLFNKIAQYYPEPESPLPLASITVFQSIFVRLIFILQ